MATETRYNLQVDIRIVKEENHNPEAGEHGYWQQTQERLSVSESIPLGGMDFMGVMGVLGQMHDAVKGIGQGATG